MVDQSTVAKYEILDTGMEEVNGSVVYPRASTYWINLRGARFQPNVNYSTDGYQAPKKDYTNNRWTYESNRVTGKNSITFTMNVNIPKKNPNADTEFKAILDMGDTFGLKKVRGGFGLIGLMPESDANGELYCIIKAINSSESFTNGLSLYTATITFEVVV